MLINMLRIYGLLALAAIFLSLSSCSPDFHAMPLNTPSLGPTEDGLVVRGIAVVTITKNQESAFRKLFHGLLIDVAYAGSGSGTTVVTYNNASSVTFTVDTSQFTPGSFNGNTLSIGSLTVSALRDNNLKQCGTGNNQKCTTALISVYTTGSVQGFVNTVDQYGAPVYASGLNPTTQVPLNSPGVTVEQVVSMANSKHTVNLSDFPSPTYSVTSDFSNAGAGSYSMSFVIQYALAP